MYQRDRISKIDQELKAYADKTKALQAERDRLQRELSTPISDDERNLRAQQAMRALGVDL